jgi:hypothetical protein
VSGGEGIAEERSALAARMLGRDAAHQDTLTYHDLRGFDVPLLLVVVVVVVVWFERRFCVLLVVSWRDIGRRSVQNAEKRAARHLSRQFASAQPSKHPLKPRTSLRHRCASRREPSVSWCRGCANRATSCTRC